jgi:serine/threonine-protein kinase
MALSAGTRLGPYEILAPLGAGGMGEVYRARDPRLGREVAIKVLPEDLSDDPERLRRFEKEARAAAALNHPNILDVHDTGVEDDVPYIVSELLEGETLRQRLSSAALPLRKAIDFAVQIAQGLAAAHEKGILHRDLKPENLFLTRDGRVKILDFGLAKLRSPQGQGDVTAGQETVSRTAPGRLMGTASYMSPEQVRGDPVDPRSDVFSFGAVLYEMLSGERAFRAQTAVETMSAILNEDPPAPSSVNPALPPVLERIVDRCLEKQPEDRFHSAHDLGIALQTISGSAGEGARDGAPFSGARFLWRTWKGALAAGLVAVLLALALGLNLGGLRDRLLGEAGPSPIDSIAVLPLENLSGDPEQEYFADGMTEALIADLAKIRALRVISRTSVMQYKGVKKPLQQIASELGVDAVVEGSVMRSGSRVRITTQLVQAVPEQHLWAESYERNLQDILALQSDVARRIAQAVQATVTPEEERRLAAAHPVEPAAHEAYLKGRQLLRMPGPERIKCVDFFEGALAVDPDYALAYAGLADAYIRFAHDLLPPWEAFPQAKAMATKALERDATLSAAHTALADAKYHYDYDWVGAEAGFQRVFDLDPSNATAHAWYSGLLAAQGRFEEATAELKEAKTLDPFAPYRFLAVRWLYYARRYEEAIDESQQFLELFVRAPAYLGPAYLGLAYGQQGMHERAIGVLEKALSLPGGELYEMSALAQVYARVGRAAEARTLLEELEELSEVQYVPPHLIALVHAALGQEDQAFAWLEKAYEVRDAALIWANVDPGFDNLRSDPRFQDLLRRMNLAD